MIKLVAGMGGLVRAPLPSARRPIAAVRARAPLGNVDSAGRRFLILDTIIVCTADSANLAK